MRKESGALRRAFVLVMLCFSLGLAVWTVLRASLDFQLDDLTRSLETSQGRERKQQAEYDEVVRQLPLTREELAETEPLAEKAKEKVSELKAERKRLRAEKKELEAARTAEEDGEP